MVERKICRFVHNETIICWSAASTTQPTLLIKNDYARCIIFHRAPSITRHTYCAFILLDLPAAAATADL